MSNILIGFFVLIGAVLIIAAILVIIGLRNPSFQNNRILQDRLEEMTTSGEVLNLEKIELSLPFSERVIFPIARKLGEIAIKFTPQNALQNTSKKLELAGSPGKLDPTMMMALQFISFVFFGGLLFLVFSLAKVTWSLGLVVLIVLGFSILGFFVPQLLLSSAINRRQKNIRRAMPDALDLLTICVEAGLGFDAAMSKVAEKWETELSLAFARAIREIQLGKLRREALRTMAERIGIPEMTSFVAAVIQSEQLGVSLAKVLRIQSDQMRIRRRQLAEEEAHKVPIKDAGPNGTFDLPIAYDYTTYPGRIQIDALRTGRNVQITRPMDEPTAALRWQQFSFRIESGLWKALDWVFPPECPGCKTIGTRWCESCAQSTSPLLEPVCPICGEPGPGSDICQDCLQYPPAFNALRSYTLFDGFIREALHRLKYNNDIGLGEALAPYLVQAYHQLDWKVDLVTAVPLSRKRLRTRGYNQAEKLAKPFAALIEKSYMANAIQRTVDTRSQIDLSAEKRRENVSGAFYANSMYLDQKSVIIIDDVSTTGSTISECARALKLAGAKEVFALTLARAPLRTSKI